MRHFLPFLIVLPPFIYGIVACWCAHSFFRRQRPANPCFPPVTVFKPLKGVDADSYRNFTSFCQQDYQTFQLIFAVASPTDPVIPLVEKLRAEFPAVDMELVIDGTVYGPNYKVCNLINAYPLAKYDILVVCDSDIRVQADYLRKLCAPFGDPGVGLVTSLYRSSEVTGVAAALEALGFAAEMVPNVMVALSLEGLSFALGASMACSRQALTAIGGFRALVDYLADDYQLGNKIYRAGYRLELSGAFVESVLHRERLVTVLARQLRWARTMRASRAGGYFAAIITQPFPAALLALLVSGCSAPGVAAAAILYGERCLTALVFSRCFVRDGVLPHWLWLLPIRDGISFLTWGMAFLGRTVHWRGHRFRLLAGGRIEALAD